MTRRKARVEGDAVAPKTDLEAIVEQFKANHADEWEALRLCPLQHGLDTMIAKLKG